MFSIVLFWVLFCDICWFYALTFNKDWRRRTLILSEAVDRQEIAVTMRSELLIDEIRIVLCC